jgi:hypothetical protein
MEINYISLQEQPLGSAQVLLDVPYRDGYFHWKELFSTRQDQPSPSLPDRVKHLILGTLLWLPIVNIIIDVALRILSTSPTPIAPQAPSPVVPTTQTVEGQPTIVHPAPQILPKEPTEVKAKTPFEVPVVLTEEIPALVAPAPTVHPAPQILPKEPPEVKAKTPLTVPAVLTEETSALVAPAPTVPAPIEPKVNIPVLKEAIKKWLRHSLESETFKKQYEKGLINVLVGKSVELGKIDPAAETPVHFNQIIAKLKELNLSWEEIKEIVRDICVQVIEDPGLKISKEMRLFILCRLENELAVLMFTELLKSRKWFGQIGLQEIKAPGDGNCFLWSCVLALVIDESKDQSESYASLKSFAHDSSHPQRGLLKIRQQGLRDQLVAKFIENCSDSREFRAQFCTYFRYNLEEQLPISKEAIEEITEKLHLKKELTPEMERNFQEVVVKYIELIDQNGSWNGEFEAEMVAQCLMRPIVILTSTGDYRTIAGGQFLKASGSPLYVRHSGNHYDALVYGI